MMSTSSTRRPVCQGLFLAIRLWVGLNCYGKEFHQRSGVFACAAVKIVAEE